MRTLTRSLKAICSSVLFIFAGSGTTSKRSRKRQWAAFALVLLSLYGCRSKEDPDQPTVLGTPPRPAYLGVEYNYNFGAFGGDDLLDFSLSNAPPWLALEETANKARPGIIMRGIPGVTGGRRGDADLGITENINLTTTDGELLGAQPFEIEVRRNTVSLQSDIVREGESAELIAGAGQGELCALPPINETGRHEISYNAYNPDGTLDEVRTETLDTKAVLVRVNLAQPSELTTRLAFELRSDFDPTICDESATPPNKDCEFSTQNFQKAQLNTDFTLRGNRNDEGGESRLPQPNYIEVVDDRSGVITLEPGITQCYIRVEVVDDEFSEPSEFFEVALTEVRQGLVSLGDDRDEIDLGVTIQDDAPVVTFETVEGFNSSAISEGTQQTYRAVLDRRGGMADKTYRVRLASAEESLASEDDFRFLAPTDDGSDSSQPIEELVFPAAIPATESADGERVPEVNEREFVVAASSDANDVPEQPEDSEASEIRGDDEELVVTVDEDFQNGRPLYAGQAQDLTLSINELTDSAFGVASSADSSQATDITVGDFGRIFVAGQIKRGATFEVEVLIFDRFGQVEPGFRLDTGSTIAPNPRVDFVERSVTQASETIPRYEVGLGFATNGSITGATSAGGIDTGFVLLRRDKTQASYSPVWQAQFGTSGNDRLRDLNFNRTGSLFVVGDTNGTWPGENPGGGVDLYTQRIDSVITDGTEVAQLAFTAQTGSGLDETAIGLGNTGSTVYGVGVTRGQPGINPQIGGDDFLITQDSGSQPAQRATYQEGTQQDDVASAVAEVNSVLFLTGARPFLYTETLDSELNNVLQADTSISSSAGFLVSYRLTGEFDAALSLNDEADTSDDQFEVLIPFDDTIISGGATTGRFDEDAAVDGGSILTRLTRDTREVERERDDGSGTVDGNVVGRITENWRAQYPQFGADARFIALANYADSEIVALVSSTVSGERVEQLVLLNGDGQVLNDAGP